MSETLHGFISPDSVAVGGRFVISNNTVSKAVVPVIATNGGELRVLVALVEDRIASKMSSRYLRNFYSVWSTTSEVKFRKVIVLVNCLRQKA